jgi:Trk-type K+ transport system membrane component
MRILRSFFADFLKDNIYKVTFWLSFIGLLSTIFNFGFVQSESSQHLLDGFYFFTLALGIVTTARRYYKNHLLINRKVFLFDFISITFTLWVFYLYLFVGVPFKTDQLLENPIWVRMAVLLTFIREVSELHINIKRAIINPAQLFILSFLLIIFSGSFLLILPNATYDGISYIDALFTSTSAVCVTGLIVVDTATHFTSFGQTIIMMLIQIGGLGILTFASYFSYFFKGGTTYENQLVLSDVTSSRKLGEVFSTLKNILQITFGIELFSSILIYSSLEAKYFDSQSEMIFFSVFHAISAFCNAGFSTLTNGLYEVEYRFNYALQMIIIFTFVFGGLGFPIVVNMLKYIRYKVQDLFNLVKGTRKNKVWIITLDSRLNLITTLSISFVAFAIFYLLEVDNVLSEHNTVGKIVSTLFGVTTPRTAGFNSFDFAKLNFPTYMLIMLLMWIGASPQSTGGGIKTSTFAIAILNIFSLARGKSRIEIFRREIANISVKRAFATITLSLIVIGMGIMIITAFDPAKGLKEISFECFSAYSTVGLSLGITGALGSASKVVLIFLMFVGRISVLSLVLAVFKKIKQKNYSYPNEEITIN